MEIVFIGAISIFAGAFFFVRFYRRGREYGFSIDGKQSPPNEPIFTGRTNPDSAYADAYGVCEQLAQEE